MGVLAGALLGFAFSGTAMAGGIAAFFGVSIGQLWLVGGSLGSLFDAVNTPDLSGSTPNYAFSELSNTKSQLLPVPMVYGKCQVAGNTFLQAFYDDSYQKMDMFIGVSEGLIQSITSIYANDVQLTDENGSEVHDLVETNLNIHLGESNQSADSRDPGGNQYLNTAYIALTIKAQDDMQSNPTITSIVEGIKVWTPTGTRYTRNPAWIVYDILTNTRYGIGIPAAYIDLDSFTEAAAYCDVPIDDKPRFSLDYILDTQQPAIDHLQTILACFRGFFIARKQIELHIEKPTAVSKVLTTDNFVEGTFSWWQKSAADTVNRITIEWIDPDNSYERSTAPFEWQEDIQRRGVIEKKFSLLGISDIAQVGRMGNYLMETTMRVRDFCSFSVGIKDSDIEIGDVIAITYPNFTGWNAKEFRVLSIESDGSSDTAKITCSEYHVEMYADDALSVDHPIPDYPPITYEDIFNLQLEDIGYVESDGPWIPIIKATWQNPSAYTPTSINVRWRYEAAGGNPENEWTLHLNSTRMITQTNITGLTTGKVVEIWVDCVRPDTGKETTGDIASITVGKDTVPPGPVTGLTALGWFGSIWLNWVNPVDPDWHHTEIWECDHDTRDDAVKIADVTGTSFQRVLGSFQSRYYWARAVDMSGNIGPWNAGAGVYGYSDQASHQDFVDEIIQNSPFLQEAITDLNTPIESLQGSVTDLLADVGDIQGYVSDVIADLHGIKDVEIPDVDFRVARTADRADELIGDALLRLQIAQRDTRALVRDAGIQVDPETGKVVISALETLKLESGLQMSDVNALFDAQDAKIELKASRTYVDELAQEMMNGFTPTYAYEFNGTAEGWTADEGTTLTQGASTVLLATTMSATWTSPDIEFVGADNPTCTVRIRRKVGESWGVTMQWKTAELPYSTERQFVVTEPSEPGNWNSLQVRTSSDAWDAATAITGIRFLFSDDTTYEIDSISVGRSMLQEMLFKDLELRITQAEIDIDGALASITLKADSTELNALGARITQAEIDIDGVEGSIGLLATKTELEDMGDDVEARFTSVGLEINAAKGLIAQEVIAARSVYGDTEAAAQALLRGLLFGQGQFGKVRQNLAYAREELTATINDKLEAEAAYRLTLAAQIDDNTAAIQNESTARVLADSAEATARQTLAATVSSNTAAIQSEATTRANADSAEATARETLAASIGDPVNPAAGTVFAAIVTERSARVLADSAEATARQTLAATVSSNTSAIQTEATTRANADSAEATARQTLAATVAANTGAIQNEATVRANADSAEATARQTLAAVVGTPLVSGQSVFAAIQNEQTVRATADSANASSISTLQTTVGGHTSSISTLNSSVNGIKSKHAVKIDTSGYVTGYELIGGADEGSMIFHVDNFLIGKPGTSSDYPFALGTVDGVTKVSMKNTFIQDAAISAAKIKDLTIGHIKLASGADCALSWGDSNYYNWNNFISGDMGYLTTTPTTPSGGSITINVTGASRVLLWGICRGVISGNQIWSGIYKGGGLLQHMGGIGSESTMTGLAIDKNPGSGYKTYNVKAWLTAGAGNVLTSCGITAVAFFR